jgi:L-cystine transport system permease protein
MTDFDVSYIFRYYPEILPFLSVTFKIVFFSVLFGTLLGFIVAVAKLSKSKILRAIGNGYTNVLRCTPAVVLLFLVYYGLPFIFEQFFGIYIDFYKGVFVIVALSLLFSASMSEIMRSSYEAVNKGQYEAGVSVGMTGTQTFFRILLPQCFVIALPNLGNVIIQIVQEGALAFTIGFIDMMGQTDLIVARNYGAHAREIYIGLALLYWAIAILIERGMALIEKKYKDRTLSRTV